MELEGEFLKKGRNLKPSANITKLDSDWLHFGVVHVVKLLSPAHCPAPRRPPPPPPRPITLPIIMCFGLMLGVSALQILFHILQWYNSMHLW